MFDGNYYLVGMELIKVALGLRSVKEFKVCKKLRIAKVVPDRSPVYIKVR